MLHLKNINIFYWRFPLNMSMMQLTQRMEVPSGSHITYFYSDFQCYLANISSFITTGLEHGQHQRWHFTFCDENS